MEIVGGGCEEDRDIRVSVLFCLILRCQIGYGALGNGGGKDSGVSAERRHGGPATHGVTGAIHARRV